LAEYWETAGWTKRAGDDQVHARFVEFKGLILKEGLTLKDLEDKVYDAYGVLVQDPGTRRIGYRGDIDPAYTDEVLARIVEQIGTKPGPETHDRRLEADELTLKMDELEAREDDLMSNPPDQGNAKALAVWQAKHKAIDDEMKEMAGQMSEFFMSLGLTSEGLPINIMNIEDVLNKEGDSEDNG
jgi:hypothetical protein